MGFEVAFHLIQFLGGDFQFLEGDLDLIAMFYIASADMDFGGDLSRVPAGRQGIGFAWDNHVWRAKLDFTNVSSQNDAASFEFPTD